MQGNSKGGGKGGVGAAAGADGRAGPGEFLKGIHTKEDMEKKINKELEYRQVTESLSLAEEILKKIVNELSHLRHNLKGIKAVEGYETKVNIDKQNRETRNFKDRKEDLEAKHKYLDPEINSIQIKIDEHKKVIKDLQVKKVQDEKYNEYRKEMDAIGFDSLNLKADLENLMDAAKAEIKRLRDQHNKEHAAWKEHEKLRKDKEWAIKRAKNEKINAEREVRRLEHEKEIGPPLTRQKKICVMISSRI